jgi:predicted porin
MVLRKWAVAVGLCSVAGSAHADIALYGITDTFVDYVNAGKGYTAAMGTSGQWASRIGMRGEEDIGGGNKVLFVLENGFNSNTGALASPTSIFNRQAWIGISGHYGEVRFGQQNSPLWLYEGRGEAFGGVTQASVLSNLSTYTIRTSNTFSWISPLIDGFRGSVYFGLGTGGGFRSAGSSYQYALTYDNGPLAVAYDAQGYWNTTGSVARRSSFASASYRIGSVTVFAGFSSTNWEDVGINTRVYSLSARYQLSRFSTIALGGGYMHDRTPEDSDARQLSALYVYNLSRRTDVYSAVTFLQNRNTAMQTLDGAATSGPTPAYPGADVRGIQLGIVHAF